MMASRQRFCAPAVAAVFLFVLSSFAVAQGGSDKKEPAPAGTPVLWREQNVESLDLYLGPGGAEGRPDLRRVTFIEEEKGGFSTKYRVRDRAGREWVVKIGKEAQSETAATRLLWAVGYMVETTYLAPRVHIRGKGTFTNVRFEARPRGVERAGGWKWDENPFTGTREFQGLKVMMVILNNWDVKDSNNVRLAAQGRNGPELRYAISDLGATLGDTGKWPLLWRFTRSRNDPKGFGSDKLVDEVKEDGRVDFEFSGKKRGIFNDITVEEARWVGQLLSRLSDEQLRDAFRAANYTPAEVRALAGAVRRRTDELVNLPRRAAASGDDATRPEGVGAAPLPAPPVDSARVGSAGEAAGWPHRRVFEADLNGDGASERVVLAADVQLGSGGTPLWEDGHRWAVFVEDVGRRTLLYAAFVPNGHAEVAVLAAGTEVRRNVLIRERAPQQARSFVVAYEGPGVARAVSADSHQVEQWLPSLTNR